MEVNEKAPHGATEQQRKDTVRATQMQIFYQYLLGTVATNSMVCDCTGLKQKCSTRYKRKLEKNGYLWEAYEGKCKSTGFKAAYLTTNRELMPKHPVQLSLF